MATSIDPAVARLCYLGAGQVDGPEGKLSGVELWDGDAEPVGTFDGVLLDAAERRVRYFVIHSNAASGPRQFLLPVESVLTLETSAGAERLVARTEDLHLQPFDPDLVKGFSEEDALTAMFAA